MKAYTAGTLVALTLGSLGCTGEPKGVEAMESHRPLRVSSTAITEGAAVPPPYACTDYDHLGKSPPLAWESGPEGTVGYAVTVIDPDAKNFVHWALVGLPTSVTSLPEAASPGGPLPQGAIELPNDFDKKGYGGPCPPRGKAHHYVFRVSALKRALTATRADAAFFQALDAATLATGSITATFQR
jgi:Raf kinase inhibitor-like YbhB/YbcL family protein